MGIHGFIIGTILAQAFVGMIIDPYVVMNVSFHRYKPLSYYYLKNLGFWLFLSAAALWVSYAANSFSLSLSFPLLSFEA